MNPYKTVGPGEISISISKECATERNLANSTLQENPPRRIYPLWVEAGKQSVAFTKCDKNCATNYRPVLQTSVCCTIQEHTISSSIMQHLIQLQILTDC